MLNPTGEFYSLYGDASLLVLHANVIAMTYLDRSRRVQSILSIHVSLPRLFGSVATRMRSDTDFDFLHSSIICQLTVPCNISDAPPPFVGQRSSSNTGTWGTLSDSLTANL